ncbi:MAG: DUF1501 domain-containing protein [Rhodoferax sp.]|nr:DUF1501 domain-containing protein [Rhodoferax sp.]
MKRRTFLGGAAALTLTGTGALAANATGQRRLLVILLRGGMDGLAAIPPVGDSGLREIRAGLTPSTTLAGNDFFGVHPALPTFASLMGLGEAVAIHATGFAYRGRSHFEGQDIMQSGVEKPFASQSGWIGRAMQKSGTGSSVAISIPMPLILRGDPGAETEFPTAIPAPPASTYAAVREMWATDVSLSALNQRAYKGGANGMMHNESEESFEERRSPQGLAHQAGTRMAPDDGPLVGLIDLVGFDTHAAQGADEGMQATRLQMVDDIIRAYKSAAGLRWKQSLVLTVTEFGRTAVQNGTTGSDHGWGGCILAAGGLVQKSGVVADWPGLGRSKLWESRDLAVTMDAKAVYAEALQSVFGLSAAQIQDGVLGYSPHPLAQQLFKL